MHLLKALAFCSILLLNIPGTGGAQSLKKYYSKIDAKAADTDGTDLHSIAGSLTSGYNKEEEKVRSIFSWVAHHIAYDTKGYHAGNIYTGLWDWSVQPKDSAEKVYDRKIVQKVLHERVAICEGYARLFRAMCAEAGLKCEMISGRVRHYNDPIGVITNKRHAWNAVYIDKHWKLIDATWAAGTCDDNATRFEWNFRDFYFFTAPEVFFNDHFPAESSWALLPSAPGLKAFYEQPFRHPAFFEAGLHDLRASVGLITIDSAMHSLSIEFETSEQVKSMFVVEDPAPGRSDRNNNDPRWRPTFSMEGNKVRYNYTILSKTNARLDVYLNSEIILSFGTRIKQ